MSRKETRISGWQWLREGFVLLTESVVWACCAYAATAVLGQGQLHWLMQVGSGLVLMAVVTCFIGNNAFSRTARRDEVTATAMKSALAFAVLAFAACPERKVLPLACIIYFAALAIERLILNSWFIRYALRHPEHGVALLCDDALWQQKALTHSTYGLKLDRLEPTSTQALEEYLAAHPETESVYLSSAALPAKETEDVAHVCRKAGIRLCILPLASGTLPPRMLSECRGAAGVLVPAPLPLQRWPNRIVKRLTDIVLSLIVLLTVFPLFALIAYVCIKRQSRGPVFSMRHMCGMNGKTFQCLTFRTRHYEAAPSFFEGMGDPGYFPFGKFLSRSRLELLPQFLCVLRGTMSIVGSQMMAPAQYDNYRRELRRHFLPDHDIKAGITTYRFLSHSQDSLTADIRYARSWGFWLDMRIIMQRLRNLRRQSKAKTINYI